MIILQNHSTLKPKNHLLRLQKIKKIICFESSANDNTLQVKIFDIVNRYLNI